MDSGTRVVYIYGLWDPRDGRLRYIGKTVNPNHRLYRHKVDYDRGKITHCSTWIKGIVNEGLEPLMEILEETDEDNWREAERGWISDCREFGLKLTNMVDGGLGGAVFGRTVSKETRKKLSDKLKGRRGSMKGKKLSPEHKRKFLEGRAKAKPMLGKKHTSETKKKIGTANAKALKGRVVSEKEKDNLKRASLIRWSDQSQVSKAKDEASKRKRNDKGQFLSK